MENRDIDARSSYRNIFKATSLFGGVQIYQILINVVKSKIIAILLGPSGVGIQGLFTSATDLVKQLTSAGLSQSAVRDISAANSCNDEEKISKTIAVIKKLVCVTGILGTCVIILFSPLLSITTFGNTEYIVPFIFLSFILLFDQLSAGQKVVLQGLRRLKDLAKAAAIGSTIGLLICIPFYFTMGISGIVPTLLLNSAFGLLISWHYSRKVKAARISCKIREAFKEGKPMIKMGIALSVSAILMSACSYVLRGFIRSGGGTEAVGCFTAGYMIINTYVAMVFNAMGTDFYPRLVAVSNDNSKCGLMVNHQGEIGLLVLSPLLSICLVFTPIMVTILYSSDFLSANDYIAWSVLGMFFKLISWCISYQFIAKGETKIFIVNEILQNTYTLVFNLLGYHYAGLMGLGISFSISQLLYFIQVYLIAYSKYKFKLSISLLRIFFCQFTIAIGIFALTFILNGMIFYLCGSILIITSTVLSIWGLDKRMHLIKQKKK